MRFSGLLVLLSLGAAIVAAQRQTIIDDNGNSVVVTPSVDGDGDTVYKTLSTIGVSRTSARGSSATKGSTAVGPVGAPAATCNPDTGAGCTTQTYYYQTTLADGEVVSTAWTPSFQPSYTKATATVASGKIADYSSFQSAQNSAVGAADASLRAAAASASPKSGASQSCRVHASVLVGALALLLVV